MNAGISWTRDVTPATWKLLAGLEAEAWAVAHGGLSGWFRQTNFDRLRTVVNDLVPGSEQAWRDLYHGRERAKGFGHALAHRARHCLTPAQGGTFGELARFRRPGLAAFTGLVTERRASGRGISEHELFEAQERVLLIRAAGLPGLYVRVSPEAAHTANVGFSKDIAANNLADPKFGMYTVRAYPTLTREDARALEADVHRSMMAATTFVYRQGDFFVFKAGVDAVELVDGLLRTHHRSRFRCSMMFTVGGAVDVAAAARRMF